ncbi:pyruvate kinase [Neobacillus sp. D3-1R]|uniref:pyruvate kinase n=1 Tax=Neobacillus sp. D3-1R TaxID=3445778 RepID=UPI003F9F33B4
MTSINDFSNETRIKLKERLFSIYQEMTDKINAKYLNDLGTTETYESMINLLSFLELKKLNTTEIVEDLKLEGLSSIKDIHPHILFSIKKMLYNLNAPIEESTKLNIINPVSASEMIQRRSEELFGKELPSIMVTLDTSMLLTPEIFEQLILAGMTVARINCAHGSPEIWNQMVEQIRLAELKINHPTPTKIYMDIAGPKIRIDKIISSTKSNDSSDLTSSIKVKKGSTLRIYKHDDKDSYSSLKIDPPTIFITSPKALLNARINDPIFFDDGKISGRVCHITNEFIDVIILFIQSGTSKIKVGKGINLPDSLVYWNVAAITEEDIKVLPDICQLADIIGASFVNHPRDMRRLRVILDKLTTKRIGVVAKIETKDSIRHLSKIILEGLQFESFGIMIARGDLAVEVGFKDLTPIQENILSICEAAHIPVIWATGVLEKMAKKGLPSRPELTDAYMGFRANCIMLNKGPFIVETVSLLKQLLLSKQKLDDKFRGKSEISQIEF